MDQIDVLMADLERVQARLDWLPAGALAPRRGLEARRDELQQAVAELLAVAAGVNPV